MDAKLRVLVVGCGNMGASHARAYQKHANFEIVGLVSRGDSKKKLGAELGINSLYDDFDRALTVTKPDAVCIATYPDTHVSMAIQAMEANCHVFLEKPVGVTMEEVDRVFACARKTGRKLLVGYILREHPVWQKFIQAARSLGTPLVMRMNLNQQSFGSHWKTHQALLASTLSPIIDCGVHYVDVMCQMTDASPVRVHAVSARLTPDIVPEAYNYGQLQVTFSDGSVGWYEAGWGPMMSECAYFVKDVVGPGGAVTIENRTAAHSDDVDSHTGTSCLRIHHSELDNSGDFIFDDDIVDVSDAWHQELCEREQERFYRVIAEDQDMSTHWRQVRDSMRIVFAADESCRSGEVVHLVD